MYVKFKIFKMTFNIFSERNQFFSRKNNFFAKWESIFLCRRNDFLHWREKNCSEKDFSCNLAHFRLFSNLFSNFLYETLPSFFFLSPQSFKNPKKTAFGAALSTKNRSSIFPEKLSSREKEEGKWVKRGICSTRRASVHNLVLSRVMYKLLIGAINRRVTASDFNVKSKCFVSRFPKISSFCFFFCSRAEKKCGEANEKSSHHPPTLGGERKPAN